MHQFTPPPPPNSSPTPQHIAKNNSVLRVPVSQETLMEALDQVRFGRVITLPSFALWTKEK